MKAKRWIAGRGEVAVAVTGSSRTVTVPDREGRPLVLQLFQRGDGWIGSRQNGDDVDKVVVIRDGDELIVAHTWMRPWAAGGEADPRGGTSGWRCAREIEAKA